MGKHSVAEDKIPLTHTRSNITYETRARFDSLLQAALDPDEGNARRQENHDNVEEVDTFPEKHTKQNMVYTKGTDRDSPERVFSESMEGVPCQSQNTTVQELSSGFDFMSSSDDDVVMKRRLNGHFLEHDKMNFELNNDNKKLSGLDKRLKDEGNSSQISQQKSAKIDSKSDRGNNADVININTGSKLIQSEFCEEYADISLGKQVSPTSSYSKCVKKPVPLPRKKVQKETVVPRKIHETEVDECRQFVQVSKSLSVQLPVDHVEHIGITADEDNDCVLSQNVEQKERKKKRRASCSVDEKEEIELKNIQTMSDVNVDQKVVSPSRKSPFHKPRRKGREAVVETVLMTAESQQMELGYEKVLGIIVHRSECLQIDTLIRHPLVKVHLLNAVTGNYLKKSNVTRPVSFYYENQDVDYILPLMTNIFDYKEKRSIVPVWEEVLVFNEDFEYFLHGNSPVLILFEVLDIVNFTVASSQYQKLGSEGGWHQIAWAFLKPVGANGVLNTEKEVRLQLYKPRQMRKMNCNSCDAYEWWSAGVWEHYPATLYVTVKGIMPPEHVPPVLRSRSALQGELSQSSPLLQLDQNGRDGDATRSDQENSVLSSQLLQSMCTSLPTWSRLPSQSCKIPNHRKLALPTATRGCFTLKFSNSGLHLACSMSADEKYIIIIYSVPDGKEFAQFVGHQGLVYELHWSPKDTVLLSASADCTACLWDTGGQKPHLLQMLPHPSFVYCGQFHPSNGSVLVTGCYDHMVRVWNRPHKSLQFELVQELEGHTGFVTAMSMSCSGMLYSGDSVGRIIEWTVSKVKLKKQCCKWELNRNMDIRELRDTVVNRLHVHPGGQRLLVHARDSRLRMLDIATASVIQWFNGALNHRVQTSACLSPCGGLVLAASEDNMVHVWNADTGEQLAVYSGLQFYQGASGVDYHPFEHMVAFASYGSDAYIVVCDYDKLSSGKDIGLQMLVSKDTFQGSVKDIAESYIKSSTPLLSGISSLKEKTKTMSVSDSEMEVFQGSSVLVSNTNESNLSPNSMNVSLPVIEYNSQTSKARLASIIKKMDHVLSKTHSKSSQKFSSEVLNKI